MPALEQIRALSIPSASRTWRALAADWAVIFGAFALAITVPHPLTWALAFLLIARGQLALAILMHDGAHRRLFKSAKWNDRVCQFLCAAPLFFSMYSYQRLHLKHHRDPLAADDPDLSLIGGYPISKASFARKLLRDASGMSYFKFIRYFIHMTRIPKGPKVERGEPRGPAELNPQSGGSRLTLTAVALSIALASLVMWGALFLTGHGWYFLFLWFLPAVTALQVLLRIRGIAEHAGYQAGPDQRLNARTVINPLQTLVFAPHGVHYHIEHHAYPAVPFHRLPELHRLMKNEDLLPPANVFNGYGQVLREIIR